MVAKAAPSSVGSVAPKTVKSARPDRSGSRRSPAAQAEVAEPRRKVPGLDRFRSGRGNAASAPANVPGGRPRTRPDAEPSRGRTLVNTERFDGVRQFSRDTWAEIKKVNWPDRETTRNLTLVVIAVSTVLGIMLGGIDYVLFQLFEALP